MTLEILIILGLTTTYFIGILGTILFIRVRKTGSFVPSLEEFFLAGRSLHPFVMVCTYVGSLFSAFFAVGLAGFVFTNGVGGEGFILMADAIGILLMMTFYKRLRRYALETKSVSPIECLSKSYDNRWLGVIAALLMMVFMAPYISMQLVGIGKFLEGLTGGSIGYVNGVGAMMVVVALYLIFGGMRAVAYTDLVQIFAVFIGIFGGIFYFIHVNWGSLSVLMQDVQEQIPEYLSLPGPNGFYDWPAFVSASIFLLAVFFQPHLLTRGIMAQNDKHLNIMGIGLLIAVILGSAPIIYFGLGGVLLYGDSVESNQLMGQIFQDMSSLSLLGLIFSSFMLIGVLSASMSTADSLLLALGQIFTRDIVRPFAVITHNKQILLSRIIMLSVLVGAFWIGLNPPKLMGELVLYSSAATCIIVPTFVGFLWSKRSAFAALTSIAAGSICLAFLAINSIKLFGFHEGFVTLIFTSLIYFVGCHIHSFTSRNEDKAVAASSAS